MIGKAVLAFMLLPGVVAYAVPLVWIVGAGGRLSVTGGLVLLTVGSACLIWCVLDFHIAGRGTLAPWAPPTRLVVRGLYRFTRNPMYLAVILVVVGWAIWSSMFGLWLYAAGLALGFHLRVVRFEEPTLARMHPRQWPEYVASVPRWLWPPWRLAPRSRK
ncbi:MAG: isoprenylcysteine carboxylmethyltransferase family protein [Betaproteobacteria bacterium]|nr:isoprenylcysteine carboxylmethyltransferase family protein [Betaproteobacteria bacterium]